MSATELRVALADDPELGAGNVLMKLREHGAPADVPCVTFDAAVDGHPAWTPLTLADLYERVAARAAWLHGRGIGPRDPVAVYVTSAPDVLLSFLALNWLGAIPALLNGNMPGEIAAGYIRGLRASGVLADPAHLDLLAGEDLAAPVLGEVSETGTGDPAQAPAHYRYDPSDPIAITHSSGTTRTPAAVAHSHSSLFAATRELRLCGPRAHGPERILSALPAAHTAGILTLHQALCRSSELLFLSGQGGSAVSGGPFDGSGSAILDAIERWQPTAVYGFAVTWAELARYDLAGRNLGSVSVWFNTGDCAHEAHIRRLVAAGHHAEYTREGLVSVPGSRFIDGIGSTEMGYSAFRISHTAGSSRYGRCVGKPHIFADVKLIDVTTGADTPVGEVGHLLLKSPTLALGYWNDSVATYRTRRDGYYLTGDLMYRDEQGYYYHVDRAADSADLGGGQRLYTALSEERILALCADVRDCTVVAAPGGDGRVVTDVLLLLHAGADPEADRSEAVRAALGEVAAGTLRQIVLGTEGDVVMGPTGKVRKFLMRERSLVRT
ncbi:MAG TPA: class I adenylate-forming enzyme family protein [Streptosporangiaceae bacterium]